MVLGGTSASITHPAPTITLSPTVTPLQNHNAASYPHVVADSDWGASEPLGSYGLVRVTKTMVVIVYPNSLSEQTVVSDENFLSAVDGTVVVEKDALAQGDLGPSFDCEG